MRGRILFVAGIAAGYVVGARAGRSAYDSVVERVKGIAGNPTVVKAGEKARQTLEEKAPQVADAAGKAASTVASAASAASAAKEAGQASQEDSAPDAASEEAPKPTPPAAPQSPAGSAA